VKTTLGQLLINEQLPPELRDYDRVLDKKGLADLLKQMADKHPDQYRIVVKRLANVGRDSAYTSGGNSFGLRSLRRSLAGRHAAMELQQQLREIYKSKLPGKEKEKRIVILVGKYQAKLADEVLKEALANDNPLARQLIGAGRGNKYHLNSLLGADLLYTDHHGNPVPIPVLHSYAEGLRPHEYFAGSFGARKGVIDLKTATQDAGFLGKQLAQAAHRLVVTALDDESQDAQRGFPVDTNDIDNAGALLAAEVGGYPRNTELTPKILKELNDEGHKRILVRSPIVGGPNSGGVSARDVGRRERGGLAPLGDFVGVAAAQALAEPLTQAQISSKHTGGIAGAAGAAAISGFKHINQLIQRPKVFRGGAAHAQLDGTIGDIQEAPQGGLYVTINGHRHFVGKGFDLQVERGDVVEAGDRLSEGIPNPAEVVKHKGIGAGRAYFVKAFRQALEDAGIRGNRRNIELLARGLINHVRLTEEMGDYVPDDVLPYQLIERTYQPRVGHVTVVPKSAVGKYLERPVLHYSVGTRIQPSMLADLEQFGIKQVVVHPDPPPFEPEMIRGMANVAHDRDWMTRFLGGWQSKSLLEGARRGDVSEEAGTSYVPALASGSTLGNLGLSQGWDTNQSRTVQQGRAGQEVR
jgi:hypothetical protein